MENIFNTLSNSKLVLFGTLLPVYIVYKISQYNKRKQMLKNANLPGRISISVILEIIYTIQLMSNGFSKSFTKLFKNKKIVADVISNDKMRIFTADPEFIKAVMIKDFSSFVNRDTSNAIGNSKSIKRFLTAIVFQKDEAWRNSRSIMSHTLTSGRLKGMTCIMNKCAQNLKDYFDELSEKDGILDAKTYFGSYSLDVVSNCAFGVDTNAIKEPDNLFIKHLKNLNLDTFPKFKLFLFAIVPKLATYLDEKGIISVIPSESIDYILEITNQIISKRKNGSEKREDFIQYLVDHRQEEDSSATINKTLTNEEIVSLSMIFFSAGYRNIAMTLSFVAYNLAVYPDYQEELYNEISNVLDGYNGEINYDSVNEMKFMDMIIDETLRLYPLVEIIDRECNKDFEYKDKKIFKKSTVHIFVKALHMDPNIYPEPEVFNPYRFDDQIKKARDGITYLPFGNGPRNCIGMRFALIEVKIVLAKILAKYKFAKCSETQVPIVIDPLSFTGEPAKPIKIKLEKR